jgi:hypothetical protein
MIIFSGWIVKLIFAASCWPTQFKPAHPTNSATPLVRITCLSLQVTDTIIASPYC